MRHHVIYIPGLGDTMVGGQKLAVSTWKLWNVEPHLFQMNWADQEAYAPKQARLLAVVDELAQAGSVSLVAASAGATAAVNVFALRKNAVLGVVCIAGKINNPQAIGDGYKRNNPAFWESAHLTTSSLANLQEQDRRRIVSIRAMFDPIVPGRDSILQGAHNKLTWTSGHAITIATQLIFGAPKFLRFLKQLPPR
jgi:hypothetical protein